MKSRSQPIGRPGAAAFDLLPPSASSLIQSLRAFSYELPTALADLVDNSVSANARNIWIDVHWEGEDSVISVTDDGDGMAEEALVAAMRLGSQSPLEARSPHDLGRFGLGMKTASFSQCRRMTVRSRTASSPPATRCWDLDHVTKVSDWQLLRDADEAAQLHLRRLSHLSHGTTVAWQKLDHLTGGQSTEDGRGQQVFLQRAEAVRKHLGMTFHRFIGGRHGIAIFLNDRPIAAWDPFLEHEMATQALTTTRLPLRGATVEVKPFILPHHSKISKSIFEEAAGPRGWNAHQGFYIYRNRRLLVAGDWLGFGWAKEEHYKLARIRVDMPNLLDHDWEIDVTKSRAIPPVALRTDLRGIGERARSEAKRVYTYRGARLTPNADAERTLLWEPFARHGKTGYRLNRQHPLLKEVANECADRPAFSALLRLIEETVPVPLITITSSETPNSVAGPFEQASEVEISKIMRETFSALIASGYGRQDAINRLRTIWPFELFPALLQAVAEEGRNG